MKTIADQLGVTKILEGGVQRAGDRVRIHMQRYDKPQYKVVGGNVYEIDAYGNVRQQRFQVKSQAKK